VSNVTASNLVASALAASSLTASHQAVSHQPAPKLLAEPAAVEPRLGRSVSIDQAATLLGLSRRTIYNRIRDGRLQTIRTIGGSQRVLVESLHDMGFKPPTIAPSAAHNVFAFRPPSR
jgi:excisionase family DNA binding protein